VSRRAWWEGLHSPLHTSAYPLVMGQLLPTLPLWLSPALAIPLDLDASYEDTCRVLRIGGEVAGVGRRRRIPLQGPDSVQRSGFPPPLKTAWTPRSQRRYRVGGAGLIPEAVESV
jgi:hypothetical protein